MTPRVLITGGSGGIGAALARRCARAGAWPIVGYCRRADRAAEVVRQCGAGEPLAFDLRRDDFGLGRDLPEVDAVVHCAAHYVPERSLLDDHTALEDLLKVNLFGPLRLTAALSARSCDLRQVLFILSSASFCRGTGPYALSKASALAASRLLANELTARGIRVDAVAPGWTDTPLAHRAAESSGRSLARIAAEQGGLLQPDDIAQLCATLLFNVPRDCPPQLVTYDLRDGDEPVWHPLSGQQRNTLWWLGQSVTMPRSLRAGASPRLCPSHRPAS
ncbi:MAG TPA: SDR family oxidoreductase [Pirellulales bacterium]|nr:SDR family oxidoreductase [Pirellulales bacterium]